jgi:plastocyanin
VGEPASQTRFGHQQVNDFFPHTVSIHAGDSLRFHFNKFHTVDIPVRGGGPIPTITPSGATVSGVNDAAGQPFWFNGQPDLQFNEALLKVSGFGKRFAYTGAKRVESGLIQGPPKPMTVRFPKRGTYRYFCDIHNGMTGVVRVVAKRARVRSARQDAAIVKRRLDRSYASVKQLESTQPPPDVISVGASAAGGVEYYGYFPTKMTVPAGTTVRFQMPGNSTEVHTASIGPGNPGDPSEKTSYLGVLSASLQGPVLDQRAVNPSEAPDAPVADATPTLHGNGFWNSGVLDADKASPLPISASVRFPNAGTYEVYCLITPFMHATITVK